MNDTPTPTIPASIPTSAAPAAAVTPVVATPAPATPELIDYETFSKVQFRVGKVESAEPIPKSSKLLKLQIDLGPLGKRQILSGIAKFYTPESIVGKKIVVVANLKPAKMMGLESQGMLIAASDDAVTKLVILDPGQDMEPGSVVK